MYTTTLKNDMVISSAIKKLASITCDLLWENLPVSENCYDEIYDLWLCFVTQISKLKLLAQGVLAIVGCFFVIFCCFLRKTD